MGGLSNLAELATIAILLFYSSFGFYYGNSLEQRNWAHLFVPGILHSGGQLDLVKGAGVDTIPLWKGICEINKAVLLLEQIHCFSTIWLACSQFLYILRL